MIKASHCEECAHRRWVGDSGLECTKGHKPRFFAPTWNPYWCDWGWKRRCADFEIGPHVQTLKPSNAKVSGAGTASAGLPGSAVGAMNMKATIEVKLKPFEGR